MPGYFARTSQSSTDDSDKYSPASDCGNERAAGVSLARINATGGKPLAQSSYAPR